MNETITIDKFKNIKCDVLRIYPTTLCNYKCEYCTAYITYNRHLNYKNYKTITAQQWVDSIIRLRKESDYFSDDFNILVSGGEPTLYKEFNQMIDGLIENDFKVVVYTNMSEFAYKKIKQLKCKVKLYPSFHIKQEKNFHTWLARVLDVKQLGHNTGTIHSPNDGDPVLDDLPKWVLKTSIEGFWDAGIYHSPYVNRCRIEGKNLREVMCSTLQFIVGPDGSIFNCQAGLWSQEDSLRYGNILTIDWKTFPRWVECRTCGACHICSQGKVIAELDGKIIRDKWQYIPLFKPEQYQQAITVNRGQFNQ